MEKSDEFSENLLENLTLNLVRSNPNRDPFQDESHPISFLSKIQNNWEKAKNLLKANYRSGRY